LPKVVTRQRRGWELNSQPAGCKSNALATRLPSHGVTLPIQENAKLGRNVHFAPGKIP